MANICLIAILGTGILCSGGTQKVPSDAGCGVFGPDISRLGRMSEQEIAALSREKKEAIVSLKRNKKKICK